MQKVLTWTVAKVGLLILGGIWGSMLLMGCMFHTAAYFHDRHYNLKGDDAWQYSLLLIEDIAINVILGGYFKTTLSSELGNLQKLGSKAGTEAALLVNWGFYKMVGQEDHCRVSIEPEDKHFFKPWKAVIGATLYFSTLYLVITTIKYWLIS